MSQEVAATKGWTSDRRDTLVAVSLHVLLVSVTLLCLHFLLLSTGRFADEDMDFARFGHNQLLMLVFQCRHWLFSYPFFGIGFATVLLICDWQVCSRLRRGGKGSVVSRSSLAVALALLLLLWIAALAVGNCLAIYEDKMDQLRESFEINAARHGLRRTVEFACQDVSLQDAIRLLDHESRYLRTRVILHGPAELANTLRVSYTPNGNDPQVPLRLALEVIRIRIETAYGVKASWTAKRNHIDFYVTNGASAPTKNP